jgi:large subunit ribosomal protein L10Ae
MSKISSDTLRDAVEGLFKYSTETKKRKFVETIELQIALKNYDPNKDKRFSGAIRLPNVPRPKFSVCVIGDAKHVGEAKDQKLPFMSEDDLKKLNKNKKAVKQLAKKYGAFVASASLIRKIPRLVGPGLNKAGKFPSVLGPNENITERCESVRASVKFALKSKKSLCLGVPIANLGMPPRDVATNITLAVNFVVTLLPKGWQQVKRLYIKSTMGPPFRVYGF